LSKKFNPPGLSLNRTEEDVDTLLALVPQNGVHNLCYLVGMYSLLSKSGVEFSGPGIGLTECYHQAVMWALKAFKKMEQLQSPPQTQCCV
jgi:hypothetical protein